MPLMTLALAAAIAAQQASNEPGPDDVVVVVRRKNQCVVKRADKVLSKEEFHERSKLWAAGGTARVFLHSDASLQCRLKIVHQLAEWDVRNVEFVDPARRPAAPEPLAPLAAPSQPLVRDSIPRPAASESDRTDPGGVEMSPYKRQLNAGLAARLIAKGDCAGAMKLVLEAGDLDAAAKVADICRKK